MSATSISSLLACGKSSTRPRTIPPLSAKTCRAMHFFSHDLLSCLAPFFPPFGSPRASVEPVRPCPPFVVCLANPGRRSCESSKRGLCIRKAGRTRNGSQKITRLRKRGNAALFKRRRCCLLSHFVGWFGLGNKAQADYEVGKPRLKAVCMLTAFIVK